jgi:hypothetical protein
MATKRKRAERRRRADALRRLIEVAEGRLRNSLQAALRHGARVIAHRAPEHGQALTDLRDTVRDILIRAYRVSAIAARRHVLDEIQKAAPAAELKRMDDPGRRAWTEDEFLEHMTGLINSRSARVASNFAVSIRKRVSSIMAEGITAGIGSDEIQRLISDEIGDSRLAWTIARTEIGVAVNTSIHEEMTQVNERGVLTYVKVWSATHDDRTRPHHLAADGQTREMDQPFIIGGSEMQFSKDPSGPDSEVINCRCTTLYEPQ